MKLSRLLFAALAALAVPAALTAAPVVSNVAYVQQPDGAGSTEVVVTYDLASPNGPANVTLLYSTDGGSSFFPASAVAGDVGAGQTTGTLRTIDWAVATDLPGQQLSGTFRVRVLAEDGVAIPITVTSNAPASVHQLGTQTLTFTFAEPVTGFDTTDVTVTNATKGTFTPVSSTVYTLDVTSLGGTVTASVAASAAASVATGTVSAAATFSNFYQDTWTLTLPGPVPMELIRIPAGTFTMGSPDTELSRQSDETTHTVTLTQDFYLGKTEVTQQQWLAVRGSWPGSPPDAFNGLGNDFPAYNVSHDDIQTFMSDLDTAIAEPGTFSLPTESQWEYACRAGTTTRFSFGDGLHPTNDEFCDPTPERTSNMWYCGNNSPNGTKAVGQKPANPWGLRDMHGNLLEWCSDWYGTYPGTVTDPTGPGSGSGRVYRGGAYLTNARVCRSARRFSAAPASRINGVGFRVRAVRPVALAITSTETAPVHQTATQTLTFTFDQPVTGFDTTDVTVTNATKGTFTPVSSTVYTLAVTGTGGTVTASVGANAAVVPAPYTGNQAASFSNFYQDTWTVTLQTTPSVVTMDLIRIPAGTFTMGSPVGELSRDNTAGVETQHQVTLTQDFYMGKTKVTQQQWLAIRGSWPGSPPDAFTGLGNNFPAYNVSHGDALAFMADLNTAITEPGTFSLPTESQWEYACRAGTTTRFNFGNGFGANESCSAEAERTSNMWYCGNNGTFGTPAYGTKSVGQKPANAWGLFDTHGNMWEWCADFYGTYPAGPVTDPAGPGAGTNRVLRAGGWNDSVGNVRSARRLSFTPTGRFNDLGFRVQAVR